VSVEDQVAIAFSVDSSVPGAICKKRRATTVLNLFTHAKRQIADEACFC